MLTIKSFKIYFIFSILLFLNYQAFEYVFKNFMDFPMNEKDSMFISLYSNISISLSFLTTALIFYVFYIAIGSKIKRQYKQE